MGFDLESVAEATSGAIGAWSAPPSCTHLIPARLNTKPKSELTISKSTGNLGADCLYEMSFLVAQIANFNGNVFAIYLIDWHSQRFWLLA
ncbi:hypothetical protein M0R45_020601 [Rubus argutus]|uniref:Uncharacterized protein n=1 Tax=Rubus argutus TaxID=59490 RepID=A0AAW1XC26_RUBAR